MIFGCCFIKILLTQALLPEFFSRKPLFFRVTTIDHDVWGVFGQWSLVAGLRSVFGENVKV